MLIYFSIILIIVNNGLTYDNKTKVNYFVIDGAAYSIFPYNPQFKVSNYLEYTL